ncbi:MAG: M20/M25/M40 family metallo-hydrolase [Myxococcota bacterium]
MSDRDRTPSGWWALLWLALWTVMAVWWLEPPRVVTATADATAFSAERAFAVLQGLIGDVGPHAVGTPQARIVEGRIVRQLRGLGLHPEVTPRTLCASNRCVRVRNIIAHVPGADPEADLVLLSAHYDSVRSGLGASDDGSGVAAVLEIVRALRADAPTQRGVLVLLNEGEELGLLGAQAFATQSPWAQRIAAVVNIEARGTTGQSYLFEISGSTRTIAEAYAPVATSPTVSSTYVEVYRQLPNRTDVTIYEEQEWPAANLAYLGGGGRYHTPLDNLENLDRRSLQHHGDQGLSLVKGLTAAAFPDEPPGDDVMFDLLGLTILRWPAVWAIPLAVLSTLLGLGGVVGLFLRRWLSPWKLLGAVGGIVLWMVVTLSIAYGADAALTSMGATWHTVELPFRVGIWSICVATAAIAGMGAPFLGPRAVWSALVLLQGAAAITVAVALPGASYLTLLPSIGLILPVAGRALRADARTQFALDVIATAPATVVLVLAVALETALGLSAIAVAAPLTLAMMPILPWFSSGTRWKQGPGWRGAAAATAVAGIALGVCLALPVATARAPQAMEVLAYDDGRQLTWTARSRAWPRPASLPASWSETPSVTASGRGPSTGQGTSSIKTVRTDKGTHVTVYTEANVDEIRLQWSAGVTAAMVEGQPADPSRPFTWLGAATGGLDVRLSHGAGVPIDLRVEGVRSGLPEGVPAVPDHWVPIHNGWRTHLAKTHRIAE